MLHTNIEPGLPKRGLSGIMRSTIAACAILVLLIGTADAEQCPPGVLGVSRTLVVDPNEHSRVGSMQGGCAGCVACGVARFFLSSCFLICSGALRGRWRINDNAPRVPVV